MVTRSTKSHRVSQYVKPKKALGQHFLTDPNIARKIVSCLSGHGGYSRILEVGPGTGILSRFLADKDKPLWYGIDVDIESINHLVERFPAASDRIIHGDFLDFDLPSVMGDDSTAIIGNFPYNISSQILFRILSLKEFVPEVVGMFQKEVAQRIAAPPGNKTYGILSVLTQAFYHVKILFHVEAHVFHPPPKVQSSVLHMRIKDAYRLPCDESLFFRLVKTAFNQRRKTLRNSLRSLDIAWEQLPAGLARERPEKLGFQEFVHIALQTSPDTPPRSPGT